MLLRVVRGLLRQRDKAGLTPLEGAEKMLVFRRNTLRNDAERADAQRVIAVLRSYENGSENCVPASALSSDTTSVGSTTAIEQCSRRPPPLAAPVPTPRSRPSTLADSDSEDAAAASLAEPPARLAAPPMLPKLQNLPSGGESAPKSPESGSGRRSHRHSHREHRRHKAGKDGSRSHRGSSGRPKSRKKKSDRKSGDDAHD